MPKILPFVNAFIALFNKLDMMHLHGVIESHITTYEVIQSTKLSLSNQPRLAIAIQIGGPPYIVCMIYVS